MREWLPWLDLTRNLEDVMEFVKKCQIDYAKNKSLNTVIVFKGNIAGVAGFNQINWSNKTAQIGYWIGEEFQGNGIVTKVTKSLINYAFNHLKLNKVEIRVAFENMRSQSIPERLGFVNEGCIRQAEWLYDCYVDHVVYGILSDEWNQNS